MATKSPNDMLGMRVEGYKEGFGDACAAVLDWLENRYLDNDLTDVDTPEGRAVLALARDLSADMRKSEFGKNRREGKESPTP